MANIFFFFSFFNWLLHTLVDLEPKTSSSTLLLEGELELIGIPLQISHPIIIPGQMQTRSSEVLIDFMEWNKAEFRTTPGYYA